MKIKSKVNILLVSFFLIPYLSISIAYLIFHQNEVEESLGQNALSLTQSKVQILKGDIHFHYELIKSLARLDVMQEVTFADGESELSDFLEDIRTSFLDYPFSYLVCLNSKGEVVAASDSELMKMDFSKTKIYEKTIQGQSLVFNVGYIENANQYNLVFSEPIRFGDQSIGVLFGASSWNVFVTFLEKAIGIEAYGEVEKVAFYQQDGILLVYFSKESGFTKEDVKDLLSAELVQQGKSGYLIEKTGSGKKILASYASATGFDDLPDLNLSLINIQKADKLHETILQEQIPLIVLIVNMILVLAVIAFFISKKITSPVKKLSSAMAHVAEGNYDKKVSYKSYDEIGTLVSSFNKMAESVKNAEKKYASLVANLPGVVFHCLDDPDWTMKFISPAIQDISGYPATDFIENKVRSYATIVHPADKELVERAVAAGLKEKRSYMLDYRIIHKDGSIRWVHEKGVGILSDDKNQAIDGIILDVTAAKEMEEELLQSQKMEGIGRLAGGVAHDFNNQLTVIVGYSELLLDSCKDQDCKEKVKEILEAARRSSSLTRQLLAFSRRENAMPANVNLTNIVLEADKMIRRLMPDNIELVVVGAEEIGLMRIDPAQLEQILVNLCVNARDAISDNGKIVIETKEMHVDEDFVKKYPNVSVGDYIVLSVSDTGGGIPDTVRPYIFEPFFTTKEKGKGSGLGLSTVYGIVQQNQGFIHVYSEQTRGSCFKIYFPKIEGKETEQKQEEERPSLPKGNETILLAEDENAVRELAVSALKKQGYNVLVASNGEEALQLAKKETQIDLLFTDLVMPLMGGHQLAKEIKPLFPKIKYLFTSGYSEIALSELKDLDTETNFIQKPYSVSTILVKLREILDH